MIWSHPPTRQISMGLLIVLCAMQSILLGFALFAMFMSYETKLGWK